MVKYGNHHKSRFYEQILELREFLLLENSFVFCYTELTLK
ncbi:hypothetical protein LEP1GSC038_3518 [Leptospira weilii str. 2006001855]|nr:hypothetical protein LEP1GSC038_3518 [Leptospira weilii str. 2006001855]